MSSFLHFLKAAVKNPLQTSTMFETGPHVGRRFAKNVEIQKDQMVVEFGVGSAAITLHLLPKLGYPPAYMGFELNKDLFKYLSTTYPMLEFYNESAENLNRRLNGRKVGAIVSTLPWSLLSKPTRTQILSEAYAALEPGGLFCTFVALHVLWSASARDFIHQLYNTFPMVSTEDEVLNIPPCRLFFARKI
ncbi:MAG: class I SAM-dependent methyltransferase [Bdellovibrionales bacterium]